VLIELADDGAVHVHFLNDMSEEFGELIFTSTGKALDALQRNGFVRYVDDKFIQSIRRPPSPPFHRTIFSAQFFGQTLQSPREILSKKSPQCSQNMNRRSNWREPSRPEFAVVRILDIQQPEPRGFDLAAPRGWPEGLAAPRA
jgi:hypothetical protein